MYMILSPFVWVFLVTDKYGIKCLSRFVIKIIIFRVLGFSGFESGGHFLWAAVWWLNFSVWTVARSFLASDQMMDEWKLYSQEDDC